MTGLPKQLNIRPLQNHDDGILIVAIVTNVRSQLRNMISQCFTLAAMICATPGYGASAPDGNEELIRQQQREQVLRQQQEQSNDVRIERPGSVDTGRLPKDETPCFSIDRLILKGEEAGRFQWALASAGGDDDSPIGRCLGAEGINRVMKRVQNAIVERGYITTRVLAEAQDLKSGTLTLTLLAGRIRAIRFSDDADTRATRWNAFPMGPGDLLNLRDIEQALENLKRVPTAEADIQIAPSEDADAQPGDSDLVVSWKQGFPLRLSLSADNSGSKASGKEQGGVTVSGDHLLALNDLFYFSFNHDLARNDAAQGTRGRTVHYSLPVGYWQLALTSSDYTYHQTVAGINQNFIYSGESRNSDIRLSRIVWRNAVSKTTLGVRGWVRASRNYIEDTEVENQRRRMAGWEISLGERLFIRDATLDLNLAYRRGTGAMSSIRAPEEASGEGTSRPRLLTADTQFNQPFAILGQRLRYTFVWRAQWNDTALVPQDRFAIGGRYTVRGFDGETMLSAERGWLVRNDLAVALGASGQEIYLGADYGRVGGPSADRLPGQQLAGAVLGLRGGYRGVNYDLFVGKPIDKPNAFQTAATTTGFNLNWSF